MAQTYIYVCVFHTQQAPRETAQRRFCTPAAYTMDTGVLVCWDEEYQNSSSTAAGQ